MFNIVKEDISVIIYKIIHRAYKHIEIHDFGGRRNKTVGRSLALYLANPGLILRNLDSF